MQAYYNRMRYRAEMSAMLLLGFVAGILVGVVLTVACVIVVL